MSPEQRREQIVAVAAEMLGRQRLAEFSMQQLAQQAGVTRALIHHYFGGKDGLYAAVVERELAGVLAATRPDAGVSLEQNIERSVGAYVDRFRAVGGELHALHTGSSSSSTAVEAARVRNHDVQVQRILDLLGVDDTAKARVAVRAWLAFVVDVASGAARESELRVADAVRLCLVAMSALAAELGAADSAASTPMKENSR